MKRATIRNDQWIKSLTEMIHTAARIATHGTPSPVQVVNIFGALFCTANPNKIRDAEKMYVLAAEKADVINTALTIEGRTA